MLQLRPGCEHCDRDLPPDSNDARICSFECTFCADCVENVLHNVCPNCGGGLEKRAIRPKNKLIDYPATAERKHQPVDLQRHAALVAEVGNIPADRR